MRIANICVASALVFSSLAADEIFGSLKRVTDGDTIIFNIKNSQELKCRVLGVDTPESLPSQKLAKEAKAFGYDIDFIKKAGKQATNYAKSFFLKGEEYKITMTSKDKYGRGLCIIENSAGKNYNVAVVNDGYAVAYKKGKYTPNKVLAHAINQAQGYAATNAKGLWNGEYRELMTKMSNN